MTTTVKRKFSRSKKEENTSKDTVIDEFFCDLQETCYMDLKRLFNKTILRLKDLKIFSAFKVIEGQTQKLRNWFCKF